MTEASNTASNTNGRTSDVALDAAPPTASKCNASSGAYVPRWKRDATVKPEPYRAFGGGNSARRLGPGEYTAWQIGKKLGVAIDHSFLVSHVACNNSPSIPSSETPGAPSESIPKGPPATKEVLRAVLNYPGANPPSSEPGTHIIWTRHNVECIKQNVGQAYPLFQCRTQAGLRSQNESRIYTYEGHYRIESAESATKQEVLEFVKARDQSKGEKPASVWLDKLNSHWLKVMLRRCPDNEQSGDPMNTTS